jgi:dinuclear metal center YbgI/SA1388 family protein
MKWWNDRSDFHHTSDVWQFPYWRLVWEARMTVKAQDVAEYCNEYLNLHRFKDFGPMGLQVMGDREVTGIVTAVSVNADVIQEAAAKGANLLIVHHGTFWNNESRLSEHWIRRYALCKALGVTLLAYHLALDAHPTIGNNILAAEKLGLSSLHPWEEIGWGGKYDVPKEPWEALRMIHAEFGQFPVGFFFHPSQRLERVAVIVGGASSYVIQAARDGYDTMFTGEPSEPSLHLAQDLEMNLIAAGHDKTERDGVRELGKLVSASFALPHTFIESPNPI